ncbi:MAG: TraR/DksA C4-type zinc finger protein [Pacificimonas sp.]|nr:TraR/DksA C4-type zinc finger protein [Pacificimonas sp.]
MSQAEARRRDVELRRVEAALARLETDPDEFGTCSSCGEDIAEKRLRFDPAATRCITCAA